MVRSDINPSLLFCVPFLLMISSVSTTTSHAHRIHLGNETDRLSLLAFKDLLLYDPLQALSSWNESTHFCEWKGVMCGSRHQRVVSLNLNSRGLVGSVSPFIGNLSFLRFIYLANNTFQGNIPPEIGHLFRLKTLSLFNNSFEGRIPANLVQCSNLRNLYLENNKLVGEIPNEFGSFRKLLWLLVFDNNLTGRIPAALGNISSLQTLSVSGNHLEGSIPHSLGQLKELIFLSLGENMLSGMVPPSLYNLSSLQIVSFTANQLQGSLPPTIGRDFPNLREIFIPGNQFSGTLPVSLFSNASRLFKLEVGDNNLVGQVPIEVGNLREIEYLGLGNNHFGSRGRKNDLSFISSLSNCSNLKFLGISFNKFGDKLPASLTNLSVTVNQLQLSNNQIFGSIPFGISKFKKLFSLDLSSNSLTGTIPKDIGMLQSLQYLDLGHNRLIGMIPNTIGNITSLYELRLEYNMLQGNIEPTLEKCRSLQMLFLENNRFTGTLPKQILGLSINLQIVDLSNNYLNGSLPQEVGQLKSLRSLYLFGNKITGEIPTTLGSCSSLTELDLSDNSLQGLIHSSFGDLVAIEIINLSQNNLSGKIPRTLESLPNLRYFNISFNNFEGEVPQKGIFQNVTGFFIVENDKLCGGSTKLNLHKCHIKKQKKNKFPLALKVTIGVLVSLSAISTLSVLLALHLREKFSAKSSSRKHPNELQRISYNQIRESTNGFSSGNLIGIGSFASVYKGVLREDGPLIAVKVFDLMKRGASTSFKAECDILRKIRHRNLLKILTVCSSVDFDGNDFKALILEFLPYGSLEDWLHPSSDGSERSSRMLNFLQRLNISLDIASALDYLHNNSHTPIVHCDLKPSNVLLNEDFVARVGDFGLAKFLSQSHSSVDKSETNSNIVRGTVGYIPPEYGMGSAMSTKGDVYSYGIMLLEMFTGRRPTDEMFNDNMSLHNFCKTNIDERVVDMLNIPLTKQLQHDNEEERNTTGSMKKCLLSVIEIGVACSSEAVGDRMEIKDALMKIEKIKDIFFKNMNLGVNTNMEPHI